MNVISQLRQEVQLSGVTTIDIDRFNQLQAEWITRAKIDPWISVKDRQPENGTDVLVIDIFIGKAQVERMRAVINHPYWKNNITHWQPLPEPPEE